MARDTTQQIGWAWEAAAETDPINAVDALYWNFGVRTQVFKDQHPMKKQWWEPVYTHIKKVPTDMDLIKNTVQGKIGFFPTNGVPLFMVLAESASNGDNTFHTVTDLAHGGTQPTFTVRSESYTSAANFKGFAAVGCKASSISGFINFLGGFNYLSEILTFNGISAGVTSSLNEIHTTGTKHCTDDYTMTGTERTERYKRDTNTAFTWDTDDLLADLTMLKYDFVMDHDIGHINNQADTEYVDEGNLTLSFNFGLWRGATNTDAVKTDYDAGSQKTLTFDINNGTTLREYTWTNATIMEMTGPYATMDEKSLWICNGMAEDISIKITDNVADDYYKD